jgi:hypothetical protein
MALALQAHRDKEMLVAMVVILLKLVAAVVAQVALE